MAIDEININEELLWQSFLAGDKASLEKIYRIYFDVLYQYGNKWLNNPTLTEDVIQDLFVKLIRNRENLSQTSSIKFYLFRSFRSLALDKIKARAKMMVTDPDEHSFPLQLTPEHQLIEKEEYQIIKQKFSSALSTLTPRQREALFLRYGEGFSYTEISTMMGLTTKATYKLMARAIDSLKEQIPAFFGFIFLIKFV